MNHKRETSPELQELRRNRERRVNDELFAEVRRRALPNAAYWLLVVGGSFALNLLLLIVLAR
jgi:hypothetical protein